MKRRKHFQDYTMKKKLETLKTKKRREGRSLKRFMVNAI